MSDAAFNAAVRTVLAHEGGYVSDPADPGGETKYGISKRAYPDLDIAALSQAQAIAIYEKDWWDRYGYGRLPDAVGAKLFDLAVNMGAVPAHELLQRTCTDCGEPVAVDGRVGPLTVAAATRCDQGELLAALREQAAEHYRALVAANPDLARFLAGWLKRAAA